MKDFLKDYPAEPSRRVAVVCGGNSAEANVSRISAQGVVTALKQNYPHVVQLELDDNLSVRLADHETKVVFPVLHGPPGEDGTFQGFLEILGYKYVGSGVHASSFAMDKIVAKRIFAQRHLPLVDDLVIEGGEEVESAVARITHTLGDQVVIKPARQGSALGITLVNNRHEMEQGIINAFAFDQQLLIEKRIAGKEITIGVIDTDQGTQAFPVIEITTPENSWYDYQHRYTSGLSNHLLPADLTDGQTARLQDIAIKAHQVLGCRDLSRADFVVPGDDEEYLLEVNTLPGMTPTSLYPEGAEGFGIGFVELVSYFTERAARR